MKEWKLGNVMAAGVSGERRGMDCPVHWKDKAPEHQIDNRANWISDAPLLKYVRYHQLCAACWSVASSPESCGCPLWIPSARPLACQKCGPPAPPAWSAACPTSRCPPCPGATWCEPPSWPQERQRKENKEEQRGWLRRITLLSCHPFFNSFLLLPDALVWCFAIGFDGATLLLVFSPTGALARPVAVMGKFALAAPL